MPLPTRLRSGLKTLLALASPHVFALAGLCLGLFGGWFVLGFGLVLGAMLDVARNEARARTRIARFLAKPEGELPQEPIPGFAAAACLALRGEWAAPGDIESRKALFERFSRELPALSQGARREGERIADVAARCPRPDLVGLARLLATAGGEGSRRLLADWAYALAALGASHLDPGAELALRASLGDCGLGAQELLAARLRAFPGERDAWTVLGLGPGASKAEIKRAYRRLSRLFHPDAGPGDGGERFMELRSAYADLMDGRDGALPKE